MGMVSLLLAVAEMFNPGMLGHGMSSVVFIV